MVFKIDIFKLLTTRKSDSASVRRRFERRRRRQAAKERRAQQFEDYVMENSFRAPRDDDDETYHPKYTSEDLPSLVTPSRTRAVPHPGLDDPIIYQLAEVAVDENNPPFVGKLQETIAMVRVPSHYEWYEIY